MAKTVKNRIQLIIAVSIFTGITLSLIQIFTPKPIILLERFGRGWGWIEIGLLMMYGAFAAMKMSDPKNISKWRVRFWLLFSIVFFLQLIFGISGIKECLMTGKLHFPIPAMIIAGPVYRAETSIMTIIFISSILLTGPAWCSQLCYFGAIDAVFANGKTNKRPLKNKSAIKYSILALVIVVALIYNFLGIKGWIPSLSILALGIIGLLVIIWLSRKNRKMIHCTLYCPIGTVVNHLKFISPFRLVINDSCTSCLVCTKSCKYDALTKSDITNLKPGITCTLCGDCISSCHNSSLQYRFGKLKHDKAHFLYLFITISLHVIFISLARI